jgi:hypothetical protein
MRAAARRLDSRFSSSSTRSLERNKLLSFVIMDDVFSRLCSDILFETRLYTKSAYSLLGLVSFKPPSFRSGDAETLAVCCNRICHHSGTYGGLII